MDEDAENTVKKWLIIGLVALVVLAGGLIFFKTPAKPPASPGPAAGADVGVRPDIIINRTKDVAGQVERNRQEDPD